VGNTTCSGVRALSFNTSDTAIYKGDMKLGSEFRVQARGGRTSGLNTPSSQSTELNERSPILVSKICFAKFGVSNRDAK
jgi:hypothetical protein